VGATAYPHRREGYNLGIFAEWMDPDLTDRCVAWARQTYEAMEPYFADARYVNYLGDDEPSEETGSAYGPNLPRLRAIKAKYDPENVFHLNQNILPA
jgi:FAD/FMN-containing dehydrogenase